MSPLRDPDVLALRRDLVSSALEGACVQIEWAARFLQNDHEAQAVVAFERAMSFMRSAAEELTAIRDASRQDATTTEAAVAYRANRPKPARAA